MNHSQKKNANYKENVILICSFVYRTKEYQNFEINNQIRQSRQIYQDPIENFFPIKRCIE